MTHPKPCTLPAPNIPSSWLPVPWGTWAPLYVEIIPSLQPHSHRRTWFTARQWQRASLAGDPPSFKAGKFPRTASSHQDHQLQETHETPKQDSEHGFSNWFTTKQRAEKPLCWQKPLPLSLFISNCCIDSRAGDPYKSDKRTLKPLASEYCHNSRKLLCPSGVL